MWPRRRDRQPAGCAACPGIRLRISVPSGVIIDLDSQELHHAALFGRHGCASCRIDCPSGCDKHAWLDLIAGGDAGATEFSTVPLKIQVRPVMLTTLLLGDGDG
jgi:hypothetical protein